MSQVLSKVEQLAREIISIANDCSAGSIEITITASDGEKWRCKVEHIEASENTGEEAAES